MFRGMYRWVIGLFALSAVGLLVGLHYMTQVDEMGSMVAHGETFEVWRIDDQGAPNNSGPTLVIGPDFALLTSDCGTWQASYELNLWLGQIRFGNFEPPLDSSNCGEFTEQVIESLGTIKHWQMENDHQVMWLRGDHELRLLN